MKKLTRSGEPGKRNRSYSSLRVPFVPGFHLFDLNITSDKISAFKWDSKNSFSRAKSYAK